MRRLWVVSLLLGVTFSLSACRDVLPTNRFLRMRPMPAHGTADARNKFDHARHAKPLAAGNVACVDCHRFDQKIESNQAELAKEASLLGMHPGSAACHTCHGAGAGRMAAAPEACTTCHGNLKPLLPDDHQVAWLKTHASMARANSAQCENCHRQSTCIACHARRDTIQTIVHERNFRFTHSIEARANPMQCGSCHRLDFCSNCHQQGKVELP